MDAHQKLAATFREILRKKLEGIVEENILLAGRGRLTDLKLVQYRNVAREFGFSGLAKDMEDIVAMLGEAYLEHLRSEEESGKRERNYPERGLEDYLVVPGRLDAIEKGLRIVDRQYETRAGILDIFAKDIKDDEVIIELKMGRYDNAKVINQIEKYINERPNARLMFVAPYITSSVFWKFQSPSLRKGQIEFYTVSRNGNDYAIRHEDGSSIPKPKKIIHTKPKQAGQKAIYSLFNAKKKQRCRQLNKQAQHTAPSAQPPEASMQQEAQPAQQPTGLEGLRAAAQMYDAIQPEFGAEGGLPREGQMQIRFTSPLSLWEMQKTAPLWMEEFPLYFQVLCLMRENLPDKARYLSEKFPVTARQKKRLDELLMPNSMLCALEGHKEHADWYRVPTEKGTIRELRILGDWCKDKRTFAKGEGQIRRCLREVLGWETARDTLLFTECFVDMNFDTFIERMKKFSLAMDARLIDAFSDGAIAKFAKMLNEVARGSYSDEARRAAHAWIYDSGFHLDEMIKEFMYAKAGRAEELLKVNENLAVAYLKFSPFNASLEGNPAHPEPPNGLLHVLYHPEKFYEFVLRDNELYRQIVERFEVMPEKKPVQDAPKLEAVVAEEKEPQTPASEPENCNGDDGNGDAPHELTPYTRLIHSIAKGLNSLVSDDTRWRIETFASDAVERLQPDAAERMTHAFSKLRLHRQVKHTHPSNVQMRNFFDDIMLTYVLKGQVPCTEALSALYKSELN